MKKVLKLVGIFIGLIILSSFIYYLTASPEQKAKWASEQKSKDSLNMLAKEKKESRQFFKDSMKLISQNEKQQNEKPQVDEKSPAKEAKFISVLEFKGNGKKQSETFHLSGNEAEIFYSYAADNPYTANFNVYVMKKGDDINAVGGFPEITSTQMKENSHSAITKGEGDYYLLVNSNCNFNIKVAEMK